MSRAHFLDVARLVEDPMILLADDGTILAASARAEELMATNGERIEGCRLFDLVHDPRALVIDYLRRCARKSGPLPGAMTLRRGGVKVACTAARASSFAPVDLEPGGPGALLADGSPEGVPIVMRVQLGSADVDPVTPPALRAERLAMRLERLQQLSIGLAKAHTPNAVASEGAAALRASRAVIGTGADVLEILGTCGYPDEGVENGRAAVTLEAALPLFDAIRSSTAPVFLANASAIFTRYPSLASAFASDAPEHALAALPLVVDGLVLGGIGLVFDEAHTWDDDERAFASAVGRQCAQALLRARLDETMAHARAAAEEANRARDEFLSTLSHELRTPLTAILGWANILRTRRPEPATLGRTLETIERNARALVQLIEDILDVSRIVSGKLRLEIRPVDPASIVRSAIDVVRPSADAKGIVIESAIEDATPALAADPDRLQQVVWNLLSNAVKFTPKRGRIEVRLESSGDGVKLQVIDSGRGITSEFLPHVFERFRQADASSTRAHGGLGLGLAISKHLVELHDGTISAESEGLDQGATFTVTLPGSPRSSDDLRRGWVPDPVTPVAPRLDGICVLLVDDDPDTRDLVATILAQQGASVTVAASAPEALRAIKIASPDVLVSDIGMPDGDGYALLQKVRSFAAQQERQIPALALTAYAGVHDARMAELAGFQRHLAKPVVPARLIDAVARLVGRTVAM